MGDVHTKESREEPKVQVALDPCRNSLKGTLSTFSKPDVGILHPSEIRRYRTRRELTADVRDVDMVEQRVDMPGNVVHWDSNVGIDELLKIEVCLGWAGRQSQP
jgi:hypothetical protein